MINFAKYYYFIFTGDGVKQRIRQHFLEQCNLRTIVRLPNSVFQPYASVATNLFSFEKGVPTKKIWHWKHTLPENVKAKIKPTQKSEFENLKKWWPGRKTSGQASKIELKALEENGFNLGIKNPHTPEEEHQYSSSKLLTRLHESFQKSDELLAKLKMELAHG